MRTREVPRGSLLAGALALCALLVALLAAGAVDQGASSGASVAVELVDGVPVGVQDTPAGALAASDNYVALASRSSSRTRACSLRWSPRRTRPRRANGRSRRPAQLRTADTQNMGNYARRRPRGRGDRGAAP